MPTSTPDLSVVMPTYNRRDSLRVTLDGLARQTLPAETWEAVVVSDGSTDGTADLLAEYAAKMPFRLRPITQDNAGPSRARNHGIQEAAGRVVVFIDDDVEPPPHFLAAHAAHHERDDHVVAVGPLVHDPARRGAEPVWIAWEHAMLEKQYSAFRSGEWPKAGPNHFYSGNASIRREHLIAVGGFDETFKRQEDVELAYRLERERNLHFVVDLGAEGIHRPLRTWESWLRVPNAYGHLDVVRALRGDTSWDTVRNSYTTRNKRTRLLAKLVLAVPGLSPGLRKLLRGLSTMAWKAGADNLALTSLSAVYNVHYLEGARDEMGTDALRRLIRSNEPPRSAPSVEARQGG